MGRKCLLLSAVALLVLMLAPGADAEKVIRHVHSALLQDDYIVTCNDGPITRDYVAETQSGIPLTDPYAVQRGEDKGLVALEEVGGGERRVKTYTVPHGSIRAIVTVKEKDTDLPDREDLVFTAKGLQLIDTFNADAGIFTISDVYLLPYTAADVDRQILRGDKSDLPRLLDVGLAAYRVGERRCTP